MPLRIIALAWALAGCTAFEAYVTPPTGPGTAYPCGYQGTSCTPFDGTPTCCGARMACVHDGCEYQGPDVGAAQVSPREVP